MTPTITLTGKGITGIEDPSLLTTSLPTTVCLGCKFPKEQNSKILKIGDYIDLAKVSLPANVNWSEKALASLRHMYLNDRLGTCVPAAEYHNVGVWSGNDTDNTVTAIDDEVYHVYQDACGPGDQGCYISKFLSYFWQFGLPCQGVLHKIDAYTNVDWNNVDLLKASIYLFGSITFGVALPADWGTTDIWDVTDSAIRGGHCIIGIGYDSQGVIISSWGRLYKLTWAAITAKIWIFECYALLGPDWYNSDLLAPNGVDVTTLKNDLIAIGRGEIPQTQTTDTLNPDERLIEDGKLVSKAGNYTLYMQGDGNLVVYNSAGKAMWNSATWGHPGSFAIMQGDGNFVVYDPFGKALWNSNTWGNPGSKVIMQDDGNLVIYAPTGKALWNSMAFPV